LQPRSSASPARRSGSSGHASWEQRGHSAIPGAVSGTRHSASVVGDVPQGYVLATTARWSSSSAGCMTTAAAIHPAVSATCRASSELSGDSVPNRTKDGGKDNELGIMSRGGHITVSPSLDDRLERCGPQSGANLLWSRTRERGMLTCDETVPSEMRRSYLFGRPRTRAGSCGCRDRQYRDLATHEGSSHSRPLSNGQGLQRERAGAGMKGHE
jgi:hypothetical protein